MMGGVEFDWKEKERIWEIHAHLVAFVHDRSELDVLYSHFPPSENVRRPIVVKDIDKLHEALAYCWKFSPQRKIRRGHDDEGEKVGLRGTWLREALLWLEERDPMAFIFLHGVRRVRSGLKLL